MLIGIWKNYWGKTVASGNLYFLQPKLVSPVSCQNLSFWLWIILAWSYFLNTVWVTILKGTFRCAYSEHEHNWLVYYVLSSMYTIYDCKIFVLAFSLYTTQYRRKYYCMCPSAAVTVSLLLWALWWLFMIKRVSSVTRERVTYIYILDDVWVLKKSETASWIF